MSKLDAKDLAQFSYIAAFSSAGIILLVLIVGIIPLEALKILSHLAWLALPISAIGVAMALMARSDFKRRDPGPESWQRVRVGLRINALSLGALVLLMLVGIIFPVLLAAMGSSGGGL